MSDMMVLDQEEMWVLCLSTKNHVIHIDHLYKGSLNTSLVRTGEVFREAIRHLVDRYLDSLGLKAEGISCHALRHSAATWARAGGAKLDAIAGMLGHTSTDTTRIYAKIVDRMAENPAAYLDAVLGS